MAAIYNKIDGRKLSFDQNQLRDVVLVVCLNHQWKRAICSLCIYAVLLCVALTSLLQNLAQGLDF